VWPFSLLGFIIKVVDRHHKQLTQRANLLCIWRPAYLQTFCIENLCDDSTCLAAGRLLEKVVVGVVVGYAAVSLDNIAQRLHIDPFTVKA
jgi:hypothetical protein